MADVIDLQTRQTRERRKKRAKDDRRAQAVASVMSCSICPRRCAACGFAIDEPLLPLLEAPYPLCEACQREVESFLAREKGVGDPEAFWHTEEWAAMWRGWLEYMRAGDSFRKSPVFARLIEKYSEDE